MKKYISLLTLVMLVILTTLTGCQSKTKTTANDKVKKAKEQSQIVIDNFNGKSLKNNILKDDTHRDLYIYLPPSYATSHKRYPVVYFLHGFEEGPTEVSNHSQYFDKEMMKKSNQEFIVVEPDAFNKLEGSFYVNSPVTGNWEDFMVKDVIKYVDKKYRTISKASARGIAGFSMGGFGTLNLSLRHPDVYSSAYIMSPGAFDKNGLKNAMPTWDTTFLPAYGAAFSPNIKGKYPYANIPKFNNTPEDNKVVQDWENGFGNLDSKVNNYKKQKHHLKDIFLTCGTSDPYGWIMDGTKYFSKLLDNAGIKHEYETFDGGHEINVDFDEQFVKFFSRNLKG